MTQSPKCVGCGRFADGVCNRCQHEWVLTRIRDRIGSHPFKARSVYISVYLRKRCSGCRCIVKGYSGAYLETGYPSTNTAAPLREEMIGGAWTLCRPCLKDLKDGCTDIVNYINISTTLKGWKL